MKRMKLLSLNVNRASAGRAVRQVAAIAAYAPEIVALHEVGVGREREYRGALEAAGYPYVLDSLSSSPTPALLVGPRRTGALVASCFPCTPLSVVAELLPWPERCVSALLHTPCGEVELHCVYIPSFGGTTTREATKTATLFAVHRALACDCARHRALCGDFNLPLDELADGTLVPFGRREHGEAERAIMRGLAAWDLGDVYRRLHGFAAREASWFSHRGNGFRLDHVFASRSLNATHCRYLHDFRAIPTDGTKLSDHAAMEVVFAPDMR